MGSGSAVMAELLGAPEAADRPISQFQDVRGVFSQGKKIRR